MYHKSVSDKNFVTPEEKQFSSVVHVEIGESNAFQRLDNFLLSRARKTPRSLIHKIIRKGSVRVNKKRAKSSLKLNVGDQVRIPPLSFDVKKNININDQYPELKQKITDSILFEDEQLLVLNKPAGLSVHAGSGISVGLIECLRQMRPDSACIELAHRLDKETSGCLIVAKNRTVLRVLHEQFRLGHIKKTYQLWVKGRWPKRKVKVDLPLQRIGHKSSNRLVQVMYDGKPSCTHFEVLHAISDQLTCLEARPKTGRTHQIRVHAQMSGFPILGDDKYGDFLLNRQLKQQGISRLMLHAWKLDVPGPNGTVQSFEAPIPKIFEPATWTDQGRIIQDACVETVKHPE